MILDEMQSAIRDTVRDFARDRLWPETQAFEAAGGFPPALFEEMGALGLLGMTAPGAFGGAEADYVGYALALIEIAAGDGALSTIVSIQNSILVSGLLKDGSDEQKQRFLPDLIAGMSWPRRSSGTSGLIGAVSPSGPAAARDPGVRRRHARRWGVAGARSHAGGGRAGRAGLPAC